VNDLKISVPDTLVSLLLVVLSFCAVFCLGLLQVVQAIWGRKIEERIANDPVSLEGQNIWYTVHEHQKASKT